MKRKLRKTDFDEGTTAREVVNLKNVEVDSKLHLLIKKLNSSMSYSQPYPVDSIMASENICKHDDSYLCECRLNYIIGFVYKNFIEK